MVIEKDTANEAKSIFIEFNTEKKNVPFAK